MNTAQLAACGFETVEHATQRSIDGIFTGDLLSWAMGQAKAGDAWFTVMGNVNTVAVASLADCACVVLCHGAKWDETARQRAAQQGINLFCTQLPEFEASLALAKALGL